MSQYTLNPPFKNNLYTSAYSNSRIYVRSNVYLPNSEIDFQTGMIKEAERRVGRTQALRREVRQLDDEFHSLQVMIQARANERSRRVSLKASSILILTVMIVFSVILLVQQGNIVAKENTLQQLNAKIIATQEVVNDITAQIAEASDPVQICYTAARELDMVPGESAQAIYLTALSTRPSQEPIAIRAGSD